MAPRPYWKGYLKLSLVACPVSVYTATTSSERVSFRQINKQTGNRLRQQLVDEVTRDVVEGSDKGRGYEVDKGVYIQVEDEELEALEIESNHTIDIDSFVPREEIDRRYLNHPYYIVPDGKAGVDAFAVIRDAMKDQDRVALGRIVLTNREHVIAIEPLARACSAPPCATPTSCAMRPTTLTTLRARNYPGTWLSWPATSLIKKPRISTRPNSRTSMRTR